MPSVEAELPYGPDPCVIRLEIVFAPTDYGRVSRSNSFLLMEDCRQHQ